MNRDEAKAKAKQAAKYVEEQAQAGVVKVETRWPIGTMIVVAVCSFILGLYMRGLFR
jgi:hypothetical protein